MPTFRDETRDFEPLPEGDYLLRLTQFETRYSTGPRTAGSPLYKITFRAEADPPGLVFEQLIDHESTGWKIDAFLKACGVGLDRGESFEFNREAAEREGVRYVNPIGLQCYAHLSIESFRSNKSGQMIRVNKVKSFLVNRAKDLPRAAVVERVATDDDDFAPAPAAPPVTTDDDDIPF